MEKRSRRVSALFLAVFALVGLVASACSTPKSQTTADPIPDKIKVTGTLHWPNQTDVSRSEELTRYRQGKYYVIGSKDFKIPEKEKPYVKAADVSGEYHFSLSFENESTLQDGKGISPTLSASLKFDCVSFLCKDNVTEVEARTSRGSNPGSWYVTVANPDLNQKGAYVTYVFSLVK